jgi:hypothetical protein
VVNTRLRFYILEKAVEVIVFVKEFCRTNALVRRDCVFCAASSEVQERSGFAAYRSRKIKQDSKANVASPLRSLWVTRGYVCNSFTRRAVPLSAGLRELRSEAEPEPMRGVRNDTTDGMGRGLALSFISLLGSLVR